MSMPPAKPLEILGKIVDVVLAYKPKSKKAAKKKRQSPNKSKVTRKQ